MSFKEINDIGALYSDIESPDTELAEDILSTIIVGMFREGYSAEATMSYLDEENHVDICEKYEEIYERTEDFLLEYEYAEYFGEDTTILSEQLELLDEKFKKLGIDYIQAKGKKLLQSTGNVLKGLGKPNQKQLDLIKKAQKLNKGEKLSKWQQGRFNKALKKGKDADTALRFSKSTKEPSFLGKVSNVAKSFWKNKTARNTAIVSGGVVGLDAISKTDKAKEEGDKLITGDGKGKNGDTSGSGKPKPISSLGNKKEKPKLLNQPKKKLSNIPPSEGNAVINGKKINPDFGKETDINKQNAAKAAKEKERTDWLSKTKNSPAAKAGLSDDLRWKAREKHVKFQKDNNRGEFKAKTKEVPSKFAANKDKDTFKRRDAKLVAKGLKPPTYTKNVKVQEDIGPRLVKRALKNLPSELAPAALMSGVLDKAKGFANKNTFIKGAIDGATGTTKILGKMVTPPKGRKLTPNVKSTERIAQGGALAVRKPSPSQKIKDTAGDVAKKVGETVKGTAEKLKKVKLKNPIPKPVTDYAVPVGVGVGIHKTLNREDYEPFELVLDYLVETQQVDSMEEALYVMMEMDQDVIYGIVQEKTIPTPLKKVAKKAVDQVKKKVSKSVKDTGSFLTKQKEKLTGYRKGKDYGKSYNPNNPSGYKTKAEIASEKDLAGTRNYKGPNDDLLDIGDGLSQSKKPFEGKLKTKTTAEKASRQQRVKEMEKAGRVKKTSYENYDLLDENMKAKLAKNAVGKVMKAAKKMPEYVRDSIRRQYKAGTPGAAPYTIEDKKNVLNWYKNSK